MRLFTHKTKVHFKMYLILFIMLGSVSVVRAQPWNQTLKIVPTNGHSRNNFGNSVAIDGNLAIVGSPLGSTNDSGSAYVIDVNTGEQLIHLNSNGRGNNFRFGSSVSIRGNTAVIGAPNEFFKGAAYVFDVTKGFPLFKLLADDVETGDEFGNSVSLSGNLAVIGARGDDDQGTDSGSAYVFDVTTGQQLFKLLADDGAAGDAFGDSVSLSGNLAVIGANGDDDRGTDSGSAYVFEVTTGQQLFKIIATDGESRDHFGKSVAINRRRIVIGANYDDNVNGYDSGSVYVFDAKTGAQLFNMTANDGQDFDLFGSSVELSGNLAVIGATRGDGNVDDSGTAYVFDISTGRQLSKIFATDGEQFDSFGSAVAISGKIAVIGTPLDDDNGHNSGSAFAYEQQITNGLTVVPDPLIARQNGTFSVIQALSHQNTWLLYSLKGLEQTFIPQLNVTIDLNEPKLAAGPNKTDANGNLQWILPVPKVGSPVNVWFQAIQHVNATKFVATQVIP